MQRPFRSLHGGPVLLAAVAVVSIAGIFGAGVLVARATMGPDDAPAKSHTVVDGGNASGAAPAIGRLIDTGEGWASGSGVGYAGQYPGLPGIAMPAYGGCGAPITAAVSNGTIDPSKLNFTPKMLGSGFTLTGVSFASQGACAQDGTVQDPHLTMTTQWTYGDAGPAVTVTEVQGGNPAPNVITQGNATFSTGDATYSVWANSFAGGPIPASDLAPGSAHGSSAPVNGATVSKPAPPTSPDPRIAQAIDAAVAQLAPTLQQCFYREAEGSWNDLAKLGIGDPRGAVPAGFSQQSLNVSYFTTPDASCPTATPPFEGQGNFSATFTNDDSFLQMNAYAAPVSTPASNPAPEFAQPGRSGDSFASWTNGTLYFNVSGSGRAVSRDVITAVATALDPNFAKACMLTTIPMIGAEVAATGVHTPQAPDGFRLDSSTLVSNRSTGNCAGSTSDSAGFELSWMFVNDQGEVIQAAASRGTTDSLKSPAFVSDSSLVWFGDDGTSYTVTGLKVAVPRETLISVAKSMDPNFSESRLAPPPSGGGVAPDSGSTNASGMASSPPAMPVYN